MGYMGFGMNKDVYTRKPRKPSKKLRELFEAELRGKISNPKNGKQNFTKDEIEQVKRKIRKNIKLNKIKNVTIYFITTLLLFSLFWILINKNHLS
ncbi:hypothetical protein ACFO5O_03755 [Geojedonia litorea]|uniref:Uncharacterized protein n=1 Tax=Geojedonia litorea TaxID=1268269 RepID=A0ABV9N3Q4_9FLAO